MIDIHNHILIDIDDGPQNKEEAIGLLKQAIRNGVTDIVATPHHYSGDFFSPKNKIIEKTKEINEIIEEQHLEINVHPGQEIRINGDLLTELHMEISIPLNQTRYVLIEFSFTEIARFTEDLFFNIQMNGYTPIIAHPERCRPLMKDLNKLHEMIEKGALAQITAASVSGALGKSLQETSLKLIGHDLIHFVASDAHHETMRPFMLKEAYQIIEERLGAVYVEKLQKNADAILNSKEIVRTPPKYLGIEFKKGKKKNKYFNLFK